MRENASSRTRCSRIPFEKKRGESTAFTIVHRARKFSKLLKIQRERRRCVRNQGEGTTAQFLLRKNATAQRCRLTFTAGNTKIGLSLSVRGFSVFPPYIPSQPRLAGTLPLSRAFRFSVLSLSIKKSGRKPTPPPPLCFPEKFSIAAAPEAGRRRQPSRSARRRWLPTPA